MGDLRIPLYDPETGEFVESTPMKGRAGTGCFTIVSADGSTRTFSCDDGIKQQLADSGLSADALASKANIYYIGAGSDPNISVPIDVSDLYLGMASESQKLNDHITDDTTRWQNEADAFAAMQVAINKLNARITALETGQPVPLNYDNTKTVIGAGGLLNLVTGSETWKVPANGVIVCSAAGLASVATAVQVNGDPVWNAPLLLGLLGDPNPSGEIPVNANDLIGVSTLLQLGAAISVKYTPVTGATI